MKLLKLVDKILLLGFDYITSLPSPVAPGSPPVASEVEQPEPLSEKQLKEIPHALEVFGMETVRGEEKGRGGGEIF